MPRTQDKLVKLWIALFGSLAVVLVVYGGFVRLTRSGLSIVEWNPISGTVPPLSEQAWEAEFAKYQTTPEYLQINKGLSLAGYKEIFLVEWLHRVIARVAGLVYAIPFLVFLASRRIPLRESPLYVIIGVLFLAQAAMGWLMVSSGLVDRPSVSPYALAGHLFLALSLIGLSLWTGLGHHYGFLPQGQQGRWSAASLALAVASLGLLVQIALGAITAGLKAGHVSNTWPRMLGRWIPAGMLSQVQPPALNLLAAPLTVAFLHRWFAFAALLFAALAYARVRRLAYAASVRPALDVVAGLSLLQVVLGIAVVLSGVNTALALLHQLNAIGLFIGSLFLLHRLRYHESTRSSARTA